MRLNRARVTLVSAFVAAMCFGEFSTSLAQPAGPSRGVPIAADTIPHWTGHFSFHDTTYEYTMVGTDPGRGSATTVIPTVLIPIRFEISDGTVYDAGTQLVDGITAAQGISASPIFEPYDFTESGINLGRTQYADAYQRANFWTDVSARAHDYHVLLGHPKVLSTLTVQVPADQLFVYHDDSGIPDLPILNGVSTTPMSRYLLEKGVSPGTLAIFVTGAVQWGGKGFHDTRKNAEGDASHTYIATSYYSSAYGVLADIWPLSHEIIEWLNDPFGINVTPGWNMPGYPLDVCGSSTYGDLLETSDPFDLSGAVHVLAAATGTYHVQDAMFLDFFTRASRSRSAGGAYSFFNDQTTPTSACVGHLDLADTRTLFYPGSLSTFASGINNRGDIVGYYQDASHHVHGFAFANGRMRSIDAPRATDTFAYQVNDSGLAVGYFADANGDIHGFSERGGGYDVLDYPGSVGTYAQGVNNRGDIVGGYYDANFATHGFILRHGEYATVDSPFGPMTELTAINDDETTAGFSSDWFGNILGAFTRRVRGGFLSVAVPDALGTVPVGLTNTGDVVGYDYESRICPCVYGSAGFLASGKPAARRYRYLLGVTTGINDRGQVVGGDFGRGFVGTLPAARSANVR